MRKVLIGALGRAGVTEVDQAADGNEAVTAAATSDYCLVLMNWHMTNLLCIDAVKAIRALGKTMPIIMVTTEVEKSCVIDALKAGVTDFIIKPFKPTTIVSKIREALTKASG